MNIIDTHSHIFQPDFDDDIDNVIQRAKENGVQQILLPNIDLETVDRLHSLSDRYKNYCLPMMGLHPTSVTTEWKEDLSTMKSFFQSKKYVAVGEIGIDLYWDKSLKKEQMEAFKEQLQWSIEYNLPVAIHSRDSIDEVVECIKEVGESHLRGVFHSFTGTKEELQNILALENFMIGINGVVTFKNTTLREVLTEANISNIIIETDAPYLAPVPHRGKRNEPAYTPLIVDSLSNIFQISSEIVGDITTQNAKKLFSIA